MKTLPKHLVEHLGQWFERASVEGLDRGRDIGRILVVAALDDRFDTSLKTANFVTERVDNIAGHFGFYAKMLSYDLSLIHI